MNDTLPDDIAVALAAARSRLRGFGAQVWWHDTVSSTNDLAAAHAERGGEEGCVIGANAQTSGRGRMGRNWTSPAGAGLYISVVLRPRLDIAPLITIAAGVAVAEGVETASGLQPMLKWPNDVYVGPRKLAGVLAEAGSAGRGVQHVVLGVGINVLAAAYPPDVAERATSIERELGRPCDRGLVLAEYLVAMGQHYRALEQGRAAAVMSAWRTRAAGSLGQTVEWESSGSTRRGIAEDIDPRGALLVRTGRDVVSIIAGEVRWVS